MPHTPYTGSEYNATREISNGLELELATSRGHRRRLVKTTEEVVIVVVLLHCMVPRVHESI